MGENSPVELLPGDRGGHPAIKCILGGRLAWERILPPSSAIGWQKRPWAIPGGTAGTQVSKNE